MTFDIASSMAFDALSFASVTAAVNAALANSREHMQKELSKVTGGVKIPGVT